MSRFQGLAIFHVAQLSARICLLDLVLLLVHHLHVHLPLLERKLVELRAGGKLRELRRLIIEARRDVWLPGMKDEQKNDRSNQNDSSSAGYDQLLLALRIVVAKRQGRARWLSFAGTFLLNFCGSCRHKNIVSRTRSTNYFATSPDESAADPRPRRSRKIRRCLLPAR